MTARADQEHARAADIEHRGEELTAADANYSIDGAREFKEANSAVFALIAPPPTEPVEEEAAAQGSGSVAGIFENMLEVWLV